MSVRKPFHQVRPSLSLYSVASLQSPAIRGSLLLVHIQNLTPYLLTLSFSLPSRTVSKEGANKGRTFYCCSKPMGQGCGFFEWTDAAGTSFGNQDRGGQAGRGGRGHGVQGTTRSGTKRKCGTCRQEGQLLFLITQGEGYRENGGHQTLALFLYFLISLFYPRLISENHDCLLHHSCFRLELIRQNSKASISCKIILNSGPSFVKNKFLFIDWKCWFNYTAYSM